MCKSKNLLPDASQNAFQKKKWRCSFMMNVFTVIPGLWQMPRLWTKKNWLLQEDLVWHAQMSGLECRSQVSATQRPTSACLLLFVSDFLFALVSWSHTPFVLLQSQHCLTFSLSLSLGVIPLFYTFSPSTVWLFVPVSWCHAPFSLLQFQHCFTALLSPPFWRAVYIILNWPANSTHTCIPPPNLSTLHLLHKHMHTCIHTRSHIHPHTYACTRTYACAHTHTHLGTYMTIVINHHWHDVFISSMNITSNMIIMQWNICGSDLKIIIKINKTLSAYVTYAGKTTISLWVICIDFLGNNTCKKGHGSDEMLWTGGSCFPCTGLAWVFTVCMCVCLWLLVLLCKSIYAVTGYLAHP